MVAHIITNRGVTAVIAGKEYTCTSDNASYLQVVEAILDNDNEQAIADLFDAANAVVRYTLGNISIAKDGSGLFYAGEEVNNVVVDRILKFMGAGLPVDPLLRFLENLLKNSSRRSIEELYKFLEHQFLPITEDGCFLGYKAVTGSFLDKYTGKVDNSIGATPEMPRSKVDDDFRNGCSYGYHVGSKEYATGFADGRDGDVVVIVKVNPADVVSVPEDCGFKKLRTAKYEVICEFKGELSEPLHNGSTPYEDWA